MKTMLIHDAEDTLIYKYQKNMCCFCVPVIYKQIAFERCRLETYMLTQVCYLLPLHCCLVLCKTMQSNNGSQIGEGQQVTKL